MATANPGEHATSSVDGQSFDAISAQIISVFDRILREVKARRDQLLSEVNKKRREYEEKNSSLIENVRELEKMRSQLMETSVKENIALKRKQESIAGIDTEIEEQRKETSVNAQLKYSCSLDQLIQQIKQFGEIVDQAGNLALAKSKYSNKLTAIEVVDIYSNLRNVVFGVRVRLHVDSEKGLLYVLCLENKNAFMVYNANDFSFKTSFGDPRYPSKCIATSKEFIYIGSTNKKLLRYNSTDLSLLDVIQQSDTIRAITVSEENNVIVLDTNGRIYIYDITLNLKVQMNSDFKRILLVTAPIMVARNNMIYILYDGKLTLHESLIDWRIDSFYFKESEGRIPNVKGPSAFCIDQAGNFIIADEATDSIKIMSPEGDLIHTIGENTEGSGNIPMCFDIAVYKNSIFVSCCVEGQYQIRLY